MIKVTFLVKPNAKSSAIGRSEEGQLWIRIAAPATEEKANLALILFLSKLLSVPKSGIELVSGASSRFKTFSVDLAEVDWDSILENK